MDSVSMLFVVKNSRAHLAGSSTRTMVEDQQSSACINDNRRRDTLHDLSASISPSYGVNALCRFRLGLRFLERGEPEHFYLLPFGQHGQSDNGAVIATKRIAVLIGFC